MAMTALICELKERLSAEERSAGVEQRALSFRSAQVFFHKLQGRFGTIDVVKEGFAATMPVASWHAAVACASPFWLMTLLLFSAVALARLGLPVMTIFFALIVPCRHWHVQGRFCW